MVLSSVPSNGVFQTYHQLDMRNYLDIN